MQSGVVNIMLFLAVSSLVSLLHARHWPNRCTVVSNEKRVLHQTSRSVSETAALAVHHTLSRRRAADVEQLKGGNWDYAIASGQVYPWAIVLSPSGRIFWLCPRASLSVNSCAIYANSAAHPLLETHTSRMTRKAPSSRDDGLVWFEDRAQRVCGKVAKIVPNWRVRETLLLVVLLVHVFGTKDGYSYPSGYPAHIWHER